MVHNHHAFAGKNGGNSLSTHQLGIIGKTQVQFNKGSHPPLKTDTIKTQERLKNSLWTWKEAR
jgi:hypothetical protein